MAAGDLEKTRSASKIAAKTDKAAITLTVNGERYEFEIGRRTEAIDPAHTLAYTLRENLGLTGTKISCDHGACSACTVIMDGKPILSCMTLTVECDGRSITTIEGLEDRQTGQLHPLQQAVIDNSAFQCGFCTPGKIMTAKALLDRNPDPTEDEIKEALAGNFCRCISHYGVIRSVKQAAGKRSETHD